MVDIFNNYNLYSFLNTFLKAKHLIFHYFDDETRMYIVQADKYTNTNLNEEGRKVETLTSCLMLLFIQHYLVIIIA